MRKLTLMLVSPLLALGVAVPAMAHPDDGYGYDQYESQHDYDHDHLDQRHDAGHEYLDEIHREAHEEGMSPWEHYQLHRYLDREHAWQHRRLEWQHRREHWRRSWDPGYYGWGGYGY